MSVRRDLPAAIIAPSPASQHCETFNLNGHRHRSDNPLLEEASVPVPPMWQGYCTPLPPRDTDSCQIMSAKENKKVRGAEKKKKKPTLLKRHVRCNATRIHAFRIPSHVCQISECICLG